MTENKGEAAERIEAVRDLALFRKPIKECTANLAKYDWDYEGEPFVLETRRVKTVLERYQRDEITESDLELWADALEMREDISYQSGHEDWISEVLVILSTPAANGPITHASVQGLLDRS